MRSLDSERRKRQHLKNKCSGTANEGANIFPCLQRAKAESSSQCSESDIMPYSYQASLPQRRFSGAEAHDFGLLHRKRKG